MAELAPLSILITADADDLKAELAAAKTALKNFETQAGKGTSKAKGLGTGLTSLGNISNSTRAKIQMASYQFQDMAVQMQMGTKTSTVMAQQLPQLASAFGAVGAAVGVLAAVGIPALSVALTSLNTGAADFEDTLESLEAQMEALQEPMDIMQMSMEELRDIYGEAAEAVQRYAEFQAASRVAEAEAALANTVAQLDDVIDRYSTVVDSGRAYRNVLQDLQSDFGLTRDQAVAFENALTELSQADTLEGQKTALDQILDLMEATNLEADDLPPELRRALDEAASLTIQMEALRSKTADVAAEAANINIGSGWTFDASTDMPPAASMASEQAKLKSSSSGGSSKTNPLVSELEQLQQSLMTQEELQIASYERQQETLQSALEQRLLTQQEYAALMEEAQQAHADKMEQIDVYRYGSTAAKLESFMGDMATALSSGNDKMQSISQAFAASEALINAWRAYSQVLADPSLSYWQKIPAALSILSSGIGAMNAIKSVGSGGSGSTSASSSSTSATTTAPAASAASVNIDLTGTLDKTQLQSLTEQLNSEYEDGYRLNFV